MFSLMFQEGGWVSYHKPGIADIQQHRVGRGFPARDFLAESQSFAVCAGARYSIAFHWTLAQFHGSMELYPVTVEAGGFERSFSP